MAVDFFLVLTPYNGTAVGVPLKTDSPFGVAVKDLGTAAVIAVANQVGITDFSVDVEVPVTSLAGTAGVGKIQFNGLTISKSVDNLSPVLFQMSASGTFFAKVDLLVVKAPVIAGGARLLSLQYTFKRVAVTNISTTANEDTRESVGFEFGDMQVRYSTVNSNGTLTPVPPAGWNVIKNVADLTIAPI